MAKYTAMWLKKYTEIQYLEQMLKDRQLHLSAPQSWDDKNDSELIRLYSEATGGFEIRASCLTKAKDRFHFWEIFGKRNKGVCLWFCKTTLLTDIDRDQSLIADNVQYKLPKELRKLQPDRIPFAKRKQYQDEDEFRILRVKPPENITEDKFEFSAASLRRIYLNPWLKRSQVTEKKVKIQEMLNSELSHVKVIQNRTLRKQDWIDAAKHALK